jgi:alkylation response protein AidB-like acyl-CoA dehydrogenase
VPLSNLLGERGDGFRIAQKRLGPGRIHHVMRWLGQMQRAFELLCRRSLEREAFGGPLAGMYRLARAARIYDGPDEVHRMVVSRRVLRAFADGRVWDFASGGPR